MSKILRILAITLMCSTTTTLSPILPERFSGTHEEAVLIISHEITQKMPQKWCGYLFDEVKGFECQQRLLFAIHNFLWQQQRTHNEIEAFIFEQAHCKTWEESLDPLLETSDEVKLFFEQFEINQSDYRTVLIETVREIIGDYTTTQAIDVHQTINTPDINVFYNIALQCTSMPDIVRQHKQMLHNAIQAFKDRNPQTSLRLLAAFIYRTLQNISDFHEHTETTSEYTETASEHTSLSNSEDELDLNPKQRGKDRYDRLRQEKDLRHRTKKTI